MGEIKVIKLFKYFSNLKSSGSNYVLDSLKFNCWSISRFCADILLLAQTDFSSIFESMRWKKFGTKNKKAKRFGRQRKKETDKGSENNEKFAINLL